MTSALIIERDRALDKKKNLAKKRKILMLRTSQTWKPGNNLQSEDKM